MSIKRLSLIAVGGLAVVTILIGAAAFWREQTQVQTRLRLAKTNVGQAVDNLARLLGPDFAISQPATTKAGCAEQSPGISLTRLYDCNATAKIELSSVQAIPATQTQVLMRAALSGLKVGPAELDAVSNYSQTIDEAGAWQTTQPIDIPATAIAGVPPFDYYGGTGQEDIGLQLASTVEQSGSKKTVLSVTATQEYHSCKSFFVPCAF